MAGQAIVKIENKEWLTDVATLPWELSQGLGGLVEIPPVTGMLFDMGFEQTIEVTTVPMLFPLDIAMFGGSEVDTPGSDSKQLDLEGKINGIKRIPGRP